MAYTITHMSEEDIPDIIKVTLGEYNDPPKGCHQITEAEFSQISQFASHSPVCVVYKQFIPPGESIYHGMSCYMFRDGTGYGMYFDYWGKKIKYYYFGCDHQYVELSPEQMRVKGIPAMGSCAHAFECDFCGYINAYHSDD